MERKTQTVSFRLPTRVSDFISNNSNHYTKFDYGRYVTFIFYEISLNHQKWETNISFVGKYGYQTKYERLNNTNNKRF